MAWVTALITVGHGTLDQDGLADLLTGAHVNLLVDIRRYPGSRHNPAVSRDALASWLPEHGIAHRWEERLGGRRTPSSDSPDTWWRVKQFRGYAEWTRSPEFVAALAEVLAEARVRKTAVMCSEAVWWRCHRRLVADVAVLGHGVETHHLMHDGRLLTHEPAEGARLVGGEILWDR